MIEDDERLLELIKKAAFELGEHFDAVQIVATKHNDQDTGTSSWSYGVGNYYARYGHIAQWLEKEKLALREELEDDEEET